MKIATIGSNFIVDLFFEGLIHCPDVEVVSVYSRSSKKGHAFAKKHRVAKVHTDLEALAKDPDVEGVYIASPNSLHHSQTLLMLNHGKHVLCEKAIASNSKELAEMLETAHRNRVVLLEAMLCHFDPAFQLIAEILPKLGTIRQVQFDYSRTSSRYAAFRQGIIENAFDPQYSNGALMDLGVYTLHPLIKLFGIPHKIQADALRLANDIDGAGAILCHYPDTIATLNYSKISSTAFSSQILGEDATLVISNIADPREVQLCLPNGEKETHIIDKASNTMSYEIQYWADAAMGHADPLPLQKLSIDAMALLDQIRKQTGITFPADH